MKQKHFILFLFIGLFILSLAVVQAEVKNRTVIFDQGHGQKFVIKEGDLQLSRLSGLLRKEGYDVKVNAGEIKDTTLKTSNVLIISGAFQPLSPEETDAIVRFVEKGGNSALCCISRNRLED